MAVLRMMLRVKSHSHHHQQLHYSLPVPQLSPLTRSASLCIFRPYTPLCSLPSSARAARPGHHVFQPDRLSHRPSATQKRISHCLSQICCSSSTTTRLRRPCAPPCCLGRDFHLFQPPVRQLPSSRLQCRAGPEASVQGLQRCLQVDHIQHFFQVSVYGEPRCRYSFQQAHRTCPNLGSRTARSQ